MVWLILLRHYRCVVCVVCAVCGLILFLAPCRDPTTPSTRIPGSPPGVATGAPLSIALSGTNAGLSFRIQAPGNGREKQRFLIVRDFVRHAFCEKPKNAIRNTLSTTASERPNRVNFDACARGPRDRFGLMSFFMRSVLKRDARSRRRTMVHALSRMRMPSHDVFKPRYPGL